MDNKIDNKPKMVLFTNWLNEDFIGKWAKVEEMFKSGQSKWLENWKAVHYAKHLVDQHLNNQGTPTSHFTREDLAKKCFGEDVESSAESNIQSEIYNKNKELESKPKEEVKESVKQEKPETIKKPKEKEFQDL